MFRLTEQDGAARLTLDRPEARNAIPAAGWTRLREALAGAAGARLLIVSGTGGAFCAGADLSDFAAMRGDDAARVRFREEMRAALDAIRALPMPTIAAISGPCFGAGVALAMACDLRVAAASAVFAVTPARLGLSYPQEDVHRLVSLVGQGQAARLLFTGASVDAQEAARIGLVELLGENADALAAALLANAGESLAALKRAIALAAAGVRKDAAQDRGFDALIAGQALAERLEAMRRKC
jgi:enoyl-CoA hydratase/carnithine racemase